MNVLILGSGGREHALGKKISESSQCKKLFFAPGNAGTKLVGQNVNISLKEFDKLKEFALEKNINLIVVGPEDPLVDGITDFFNNKVETQDIIIIGPSKLGAQLEGSKHFAKEFMQRHNIPTAKSKTFTKENIQDGYNYLETLNSPYVLKADGLAAGKGVLIIDKIEEAKQELNKMVLEKKFGIASSKVVIEEFLKGIEFSVFILSDGDSYKILPSAKDYKRIGEGDQGLNTGGMGAVSPVPFIDRFFMEKVDQEIIKPTVEGLKKDGILYQGFIFIGLIKVGSEAKVIEYNVRLGDPETEVIIPRIKSDFLNLLKGIGDGTFSEKDLNISSEAAATVMLVSEGYPEKYEKGFIIDGLEKECDSIFFHAGTISSGEKTITNGGRVLAVTSFGQNTAEAIDKSYENLKLISFKGKKFRNDIGFDL
ncbi:phosphoribosylamine--glycine ligase [Flavobacteriales bacterium]|jgi:phosphoribosylamine--glycine ligase|nr:phosphoribosylamine--glycine ligase [Flavobacteriales bacterium]|tara:strand:- start:37459 stop:38730 length:1272 start_codon:yes stop_codon:yes gene_type:complete